VLIEDMSQYLLEIFTVREEEIMASTLNI
jgi:hypothetical protein